MSDTPTSDTPTSDTPTSMDRIEALEMRVAHQDRTIEELNAAVTAQWRTIDALTRKVASLGERLEDVQKREPGAPEPPPPHY